MIFINIVLFTYLAVCFLYLNLKILSASIHGRVHEESDKLIALASFVDIV